MGCACDIDPAVYQPKGVEMGKTLSEVLAEGREGLKFSAFVDQVLTFLEVEVKEGSQFGNYGIITALTAGGDEVVITNGGVAFDQLLAIKAEDLLPCELQVRAFPGQFGKTGYALDEVVAPSA